MIDFKYIFKRKIFEILIVLRYIFKGTSKKKLEKQNNIYIYIYIY